MSLQSIIQQIKTATLPGENTALRVGSALEQMDAAKRDKSDSLSASETINMVNAVKLLAVSGTPFLGTIEPASTIPAGNFWAFAGEGTYANAGGIVIGTGEIAIITRVGATFDSIILDVPVKSINTVSKTGTVGLVDTYTITYTDGSTPTTFEVKNGSTPSPNLRLWSALPFSKDEQVVKDSVIYIALENVLDTDVPGVSAKWKSLGSDDEDVRIALKWFLEQQSGGTEVLDKTFEISNTASYGNLYGVASVGGLLQKTGVVVNYVEAGSYFNVWNNIPTKTNGIKKIIAKITPYGNDSPNNPTNANIVGIKENGSVIPLVLNPGASSGALMTYELDITEYESISVGLINFDSNPISLTQTIEFYKVGAGQSLENSVKKYIDENTGGISPEFDPTTTTEAQGGKQIYDYFSTIKEGTAPKTEITARIVNNYVNNSAQLLPLNGYTTTGVIDLSDDIKVINVSNWNPPTNDYGIKFYTVNNVFIVENKQKGTFNIDKPSNAAKFAISYINFAASSDFRVYTSPLAPIEDKGTSSKVDIVDTAVKYKPVNSVGIEKYFTESLSDLPKLPDVYSSNVQDIIYDIDQFIGTDDQKIDKAISMVENVGGGQVYFPNRPINITKAIPITSNTKFILDNCQIQMANGIHDNIFRSKGLKINSALPNGLQTEASWTENFEIIGIGMPTIRQSVTPLHVGDAYGWRGISILFARCRNYSLKNIKVIESHMWGISNEFSENGYFENLEFQNTLHPNADGLNFRNGCRNMYAKKIRGITNDNAVATTILDSTIPVSPNAGYSYQALGWTFGDYWGAENIIVEDVQVRSKYGSALILGTSRIVQNITYKDIVSTSATPSGQDWDNVSVCGNRYRNFVYGSSYVDGNVRNINIINSNTSVHQYSLGVYGGKIQNLFTNKIINTKPGKLGDVKNDTTTVINQV